MTQSIVRREEIAQVVESVWTTVLGLEVAPCIATDPRDTEADLSVSVYVSGAWNGAICFWPTMRFASKAAALLFAMPECEVQTADIHDGMAELGNMVAGNLKSLLPSPSFLSLPAVTRGPSHEIFVRRATLVANLAFDCNGEPLGIRVMEGTLPVESASEA